MKRVFASLFVLFVLSVGLADAADQPISEAEQAVFLADHLGGLPHKQSLRYSFERSGALEKPFKDEVTMSVSPGATAEVHHVSVSYLTGENRVELPDTDEARANPVVLYFLERDVREMQRITGGKSAYYRKRLRSALAESATVRAIKFDYQGAPTAGKVISIDPFRDDPVRSRFERFANKTYDIIVSDAVPGGIYEMHSTMKAGADDPKAAKDSVLVEEVLRFKGVAK